MRCDQFRRNVTNHSAIVTSDSGYSPKIGHVEIGISGHVPPESAVTLQRNQWSRSGGIRSEYKLSVSSTDDMTWDLKEAIARKGWIVVTTWTSHWMFAAYDLRFLDDPMLVFGKDQRVFALARPAFPQDEPAAAVFLTRIDIPIDELKAALLDAERSPDDQAVANHIKNPPAHVNY